MMDFEDLRAKVKAGTISDQAAGVALMGIDWGKGPSSTVTAIRRGMEFVCQVPSVLGAVTSMEVRNGKVVCHTESGIELIVPSNPPQR